VKVVRAPLVNKTARKITDDEYRDVLRLASLRVWTLKSVIKQHNGGKPK
jgi:hypothetical protein